MTRYLDNTPFTPYFRERGSFSLPTVGSVSVQPTVGRAYHIMCPCTILGMHFYNPIAGDTTFRFGLWHNLRPGTEIEYTQCRVETTLAQGTHDIMFAEPVHVGWDEIALQHDLGDQCWWLAIRALSGLTWINGSTSVGYPMPSLSICQPGEACLSTGQLGVRGNAGTWELPNYTGTGGAAIDMLVVADESTDGYDHTPLCHIYGASHDQVYLDTTTGDRTVGVQFYANKPGNVLHGLRFYTHDPNPWGGTLKAWYPINSGFNWVRMDAGAGTVSCNGAGIYDVLFPTPIVVTADHMRYLGNQGKGFAVGIRNTTNNNYTVCDYSIGDGSILPLSRAGDRFANHWSNYMYGRYGGSPDSAPEWNITNLFCPSDPLVSGS